MLDVTMTCMRRPEIINRTLTSFFNMLKDEDDVRIIANIDPIGPGTNKDVKDVISSFGKHIITQNTTAGFSKALKRIWLKTKSPLVFNLEDDWIFNRPIKMNIVRQMFELFPELGHLALRSKAIKRGDVDHVLGVGAITWKPGRKKFTLAPSFWRLEIIKIIAQNLDLGKDPEKQLWEGRTMGDRLTNYYSAWLGRRGDSAFVEDIGRDWAKGNGGDVLWK